MDEQSIGDLLIRDWMIGEGPEDRGQRTEVRRKRQMIQLIRGFDDWGGMRDA